MIADTLFRRRGKKVHGAGWFHDGSAAGQVKLVFGDNWVVAAIIVTLLQAPDRTADSFRCPWCCHSWN